MGIRGRKPKPIALREFEGNPGKRPLRKKKNKVGGKSGVSKKMSSLYISPKIKDAKLKNKNQPNKKDIFHCPPWLNKVAKVEWQRIAPVLKRLRILDVIDRTALATYCQSYARIVEAEEVLEKEGTTYENSEGNFVQRPEVGISQRYMQICKNLLVEFGMTPSSRGRMTFPGEGGEGELEKKLG